MKKKRFATILLIIACSGSLLLFSGCKHRDYDDHHEFVMDYIEDALDLTKEQKTLVDQYEEELSDKVDVIKKNHRDMYVSIKEQLASDEIDVAKMKELAAEHRKMTAEVVDMTIERIAVVHKTLSPEQKEKLIKKMEKFEKWHLNDD